MQYLLDTGFDPKQATFWMIEGLFPYLQPETLHHFLSCVDKLSVPTSQFVTEMNGGGDMTMASHNGQNSLTIHCDFHYGENASIFRDFPWMATTLGRRNQAAEYYGTIMDQEKLGRLCVRPAETLYGPWLVLLFDKPSM